MQRKLVRIGGLLAAFGLVTGLSSVFVPWVRQLVVTGAGYDASQRVAGVTILNIVGGLWYVLLLLTLVALLGAAALGTDLGRKVAGIAGPVVSLATASLVVGLITTADSKYSVAAGGWLALASMPLLGFACGLIAIGRAPGVTAKTPV